MLNLRQKLVGEPADGGGRHLVQHARLHALAEAARARGAQHVRRRVAQPAGPRRALLRVEHGLADVERRGGGGRQRAARRARQRVRERVVGARGVELLLAGLVGDEVQRLEGHVHGELRAVRAVEGARALRAEHVARALPHAAVRRVQHLHALLHHLSGVGDGVVYERGDAPRQTVRDVVVPVAREVRQRVLAVLVGGEVAGVRRARAQHHGGHAAHGPEQTFLLHHVPERLGDGAVVCTP